MKAAKGTLGRRNRRDMQRSQSVAPNVTVMVDNCYGEFTGEHEPTEYGVDIMAGSLIKNPGGGLAPTGGYIVGRKDLVENAAMRLTTPGIGGECGASLGITDSFPGLFHGAAI